MLSVTLYDRGEEGTGEAGLRLADGASPSMEKPDNARENRDLRREAGRYVPRRGAGVRSMLTFGGNVTGFNVMQYFARNADNALIGKFWGAYQLGLYSRAYQMLLMPMQQINAPLAAVAVPALSRLADSPERYRDAYLKILEKLVMITMPLGAFNPVNPPNDTTFPPESKATTVLSD